jgi:hypothetical protein
MIGVVLTALVLWLVVAFALALLIGATVKRADAAQAQDDEQP